MDGFSLSSSPSSEDGQVTVCPDTTATLTCTASQVTSQGWRDQNRLIGGFVSTDNESRVIEDEDGPYTLTLVTVDDDDDGDSLANFTSTLEVMVDDIPNGTNISCTIFRNLKDLTIYRASIYIDIRNAVCCKHRFVQVPHLHHLM